MVEASRYDKPRYKVMGVAAAIVVHGGLLLFFIFYVLTTPIPPFPEDGGGGPGMGIEVNLGLSENGSGMFQEDIATPEFNEVKTQPQVTKTEDTKEELIASDNDKESEAIKTTDNKKDNKTKKDVTVKNTTTTTDKKENKTTTTDEKKQEVNVHALYKKKTDNITNQGDGTGTGDKGNPNGNPLSNKYTGNGTGGDGNGPGAGGGTGGGFGTGTGTGVGSGVSFSLNGRIKQYMPYPEKVKNRSGIVVVEIKVDKAGNVVDAIPGAKGSTTLDDNLLRVAKDAALKTKFERKPDAPEFQKGLITYTFILQ